MAWGTYMVPFKKTCLPAGRFNSSNLIQFQALIAVAIGVSGLMIALVLGYPLNLNTYGLISGALWAIANAISLTAITNLGLSRAVPLMGSLVVITSFLWGALVFKEFTSGMMMGFAGVLLIVLGVVLVGITGSTQSQNAKKGLAMGILAGLIWGSQLVPLKVGNMATSDFFFAVCLGIFLTGLVIFGLRRKRFTTEAVEMSLLSGLIWNVGNLLSLVALSVIGLSKAGPTSQLAILIAVLWGLFYFKEITKPRARAQVLIGAVILLSGVITLGLA